MKFGACSTHFVGCSIFSAVAKKVLFIAAVTVVAVVDL